MLCPNCNYDLSHSKGQICPECGVASTNEQRINPAVKLSDRAFFWLVMNLYLLLLWSIICLVGLSDAYASYKVSPEYLTSVLLWLGSIVGTATCLCIPRSRYVRAPYNQATAVPRWLWVLIALGPISVGIWFLKNLITMLIWFI